MLAVIGLFTYEFTTTLPLLAEFTFGAGSAGLATMTALMGVGAVVGGLVIASGGAPTARRLVTVAAVFGMLVILVSIMPTIGLVYVVMPFVGAASVGVIALSNATLQLNADPQLRGRVMAIFSMALMGSTPIGGPLMGWIGETYSARASLLVGGVAAVAAAGYGWVRLNTSVRTEAQLIEVAPAEPASASA